MDYKNCIVLDRSILDDEIWMLEESFCRRDAWIDILLHCCHYDCTKLINGEVVTVVCGEYSTSQDKLSKRFGWTRQALRTFLKDLANLGKITLRANNKYTIIHVVNFEQYVFECLDNSAVNQQLTNAQPADKTNSETTAVASSELVTVPVVNVSAVSSGRGVEIYEEVMSKNVNSDAGKELEKVYEKVGKDIFYEACKIAYDRNAYSYKYVVKVATRPAMKSQA